VSAGLALLGGGEVCFGANSGGAFFFSYSAYLASTAASTYFLAIAYSSGDGGYSTILIGIFLISCPPPGAPPAPG